MSPNTACGGARKPSQEERLIQATIELAAERGFGETSLTELTARARISRATFYELYEDKEELFAAGYIEAGRRVLDDIRDAVRGRDFWKLQTAALEVLLAWLEREPEAGWMLFVEVLAGGARVRAEHRRVAGEFERLAEAMMDQPPESEQTLDLPATALVGGVRMIVAQRLRSNEADRLPGLHEELLRWMRSYAIPTTATRSSVSAGSSAAAASQSSGSNALEPLGRPKPLPRGNHNLPAGVVARNQRQRILWATGEASRVKGYQEMTVADIVADAGIARSVFYEHFQDKLDAFLGAQQHVGQVSVAACSSAFFGAEAWPERIWNALTALTKVVVAQPALAHLLLVESFAAGHHAIERLSELLVTFRIFLEEGYHQNPGAAELPRLCSEAIVGAIFEILHGQVAGGQVEQLPGRVPQLTYIALAPFIGAREAVEVVEKIGAAARRGDGPRRLGVEKPA